MAVADTFIVTHATIDPDNGAVEIEFDINGNLHPHAFVDVNAIAGQFSGQAHPDTGCWLIYAWFLSRDPSGVDLDLIRGKTFEFDWSAQNIMKVSNT